MTGERPGHLCFVARATGPRGERLPAATGSARDAGRTPSLAATKRSLLYGRLVKWASRSARRLPPRFRASPTPRLAVVGQRLAVPGEPLPPTGGAAAAAHRGTAAGGNPAGPGAVHGGRCPTGPDP